MSICSESCSNFDFLWVIKKIFHRHSIKLFNFMFQTFNYLFDLIMVELFLLEQTEKYSNNFADFWILNFEKIYFIGIAFGHCLLFNFEN
jgi:hypothetical protein